MTEFQMPAVEAGDIVYWYRDARPQTKPSPAIVTDVGSSAISVSVIHPDRLMFEVHSGVFHIDDARAQAEFNDEGAWCHRSKGNTAGKKSRQLEEANA